MKKLLIVFCFMQLLCYSSFAQDKTKEKGSGKIGLTFSSFGANEVYYTDDLDGAGSYDSDNFFTIGVNYIRPINNWLDLEACVEYSKHNIFGKPNLPPDMDNSKYKTDFSLLSIPVGLRANFWKYLFVNGGLFLDFDLNNSSQIDSQAGVGALLGIGVNYDFSCGLSVFTNPYIKTHALLPFARENHPQKLLESGFRFGVMIDLN